MVINCSLKLQTFFFLPTQTHFLVHYHRLSRDYVEKHPQIDWEVVEGLRHVLVHDYYSVNMNTIWEILEKDLPVMKRFLIEAKE